MRRAKGPFDTRWAGRRALLLLALAMATPRASVAAEVTDVASSFDTDNPFDFRLRVGYLYSNKTAAIKRESEGPGQDSILLYKDLVYRQTRHTMDLGVQVGLYKDLMFSIGLPMVISDNRELAYDQRLGGECNYTGKDANCVDSRNSSTVTSSLRWPDDLSNPSPDGDPTHYIVPAGGYDALNMGGSFGAPNVGGMGSDLVFRGPKRGGSGTDMLDTINFRLTWAALSQKRDDTKPTWTVGIEYDVSIGNIMKFDRSRPDANHAVSDGLDHFAVHTAVSHRFRWIDPYILFWYDLPIVRRDDTLFINYGPQEKNQQPQMSAGTTFGFEGVPWEQPEKEYKIAIDLNARISAMFDGRGYSEIWEMLASSPALRCETDPMSPNFNKACVPGAMGANGPVTNPYQGTDYTGLTVIENYARLGAEIALLVQAGHYVRFRASFLYQHDQAHFLTVDDVGKPNVSGGRVNGPDEFNPAFRPIIDEPGRRYKADGADIFNVGVWGQAMF
jgi:hypothetical protein